MTESKCTERNAPRAKVPLSLRITAISLRTTFIILLGLLTLRVTLPERQTVFSASVKWDDLVRTALGLAVCLWLVAHLFKDGPQSMRGHQTWLYLGLAAVPFALFCLIGIW